MKLANIKLKLLLLIILCSVISIQVPTQSAILVETLYSYPLRNGFFNDLNDMWDSVKVIDVTLYNVYEPYDTITISLLSSFNLSDNMLYFNLLIPDSSQENDHIDISFRTSQDDFLYKEDDQWSLGFDHDMKVCNFEYQTYYDCITEGWGFGRRFDDTNSGTTDLAFSSIYEYANSRYLANITTPLDSGDTNGHDIALTAGSSIEFCICYYDPIPYSYYTPITPDETDYEYCILHIGAPDPIGTSGFFVISCLLSSTIILSYNIRRRKIKTKL